jgi:hypothetical protein
MKLRRYQHHSPTGVTFADFIWICFGFTVVQVSADYTITMFGFDFRQGQGGGLSAAEVDVGWREIVQALVITAMVVIHSSCMNI